MVICATWAWLSSSSVQQWNLSSVAIIPQAPWEQDCQSASFLFLFKKKKKKKTLNLLTLGRGCVVAVCQRAETKQTMGVIERWNRWHYWGLITSFAHRHRTLQLLGYKIHTPGCVLGCVSVKGLEMTGSSGSHSGWKKVVSGYQRIQPCLDGSLLLQRGELLPYGEGLNYPPPTAESTFDYVLPKAALKSFMQISLLCLFLS